MHRVLDLLLTVFVPPRASERTVATLTANELALLQTTRGLPYRDRRVSALVWELKYYANRRAAALGGALLAPQLIEIGAEEVGVPLLIPIPMHKARLKERGYNQTELLCQAALTHTSEFEYLPTALRRVTHTTPQQGLERTKRLKNIKNSMRASSRVKNRVCIVVDDVTTTGATLNEATRALQKAGAREVHPIALAYS